MGALHNELNRGSFSKAIKNALGVKEGESGVERFGETLTPTLDIFRLPEWKYLRSEHWFGVYVSLVAAPAGRFAGLMIRENKDDQIAVIEAILTDSDVVVGPAVNSITINEGIANVVTQTAYAMDRRFNTEANGNPHKSTALIQSGDFDGTRPEFPWFRTMAAGIFYRPPIILTRKLTTGESGMMIVHTTAATALKLSVIFRERQAAPEER